MIFDLFQEGKSLVRVIVLSDLSVMDLENGVIIYNIDFDNDVESILIEDVFSI